MSSSTLNWKFKDILYLIVVMFYFRQKQNKIENKNFNL